jgi:hypothetical protein
MEQKKSVNKKSINSLTFGIVSILIPFIGIILGIIGFILANKSLKEIEASNENGFGLAIGGRICSIVGILISLFLSTQIYV